MQAWGQRTRCREGVPARQSRRQRRPLGCRTAREAQLLTVQTVTSRKNLRLSLVSSGIASTGCMVRSCAALGCVDFRLQRCIEQMHLIARYRGLWTHTGKDASTGLTV